MCWAACMWASGCLEDEIHTLNRLEEVPPSPVLIWILPNRAASPDLQNRTYIYTTLDLWRFFKRRFYKRPFFYIENGTQENSEDVRPEQAEPARPFLLRAQLPNQRTMNSHRMPDIHPWGWWLPAQNVSFVPGYHKYHRYLLLLWHVKGWETTESSVLLILGVRTINYDLES